MQNSARQFLLPNLLLLAVTVVTCMLGSCSNSEKGAGPALNSLQEDVKPEKITVLTWEEYFSPEVIRDFESETGIEVEFVYFENLEEMRGLLQSRPGAFDVLVSDGGGLADLIELQLLKPIQRELIPNFSNMDSRYLDLRLDPQNAFSVPYMWGTTLIAYRSDLIPEPVQSWNALKDEKYKGRVLMLDDTFDSYAAALLSLGFDINTENPKELGAAAELLLDQVDRMDARFEDIIGIREKLLSGECWIGMTYSSDAAVLAEENKNIAYFIPKEGAALWLDSFAVAREASNSAGAHQFIDFLCRGEVAGKNSSELWCASANRAAQDYLSAEVLAEETLYPASDILKKCQFAKQAGATRNLSVNQGMKLIYDHLARRNNQRTENALAVKLDGSDTEGNDAPPENP